MSKLADIAAEHLGEPGATDTCLRAVNRWVQEAGGQPLPTESVSAAVQLAQQGRNGWTYHDGLDGVQVGDVLRWARAALKPSAADPNPEHVSVLTATQGHNLRSIGSGGPSGKVAVQPQGGGFNPPSAFRGYFRVKLAAPAPAAKPPAAAPKPASAPKPATAKAGDITVRAGDTLWQLARDHRTTVAAILRANPPAANHRTQDYSIVRQDLILKGQRLHLP